MEGRSYHMTPEEFRRHGHALIDWLADLSQRIDTLPVVAPVEPGEIAGRLPDHAPAEPEEFAALLRDLDDIVLPGITHWQHPGWFAYFPANASGPSILAELAAAGLGVQGMLWSTSPACTEIEATVVDWLVDLLGLPEHFMMATGPGGGSIQVSASDATHLVHVVARHRATEAGAGTDDLVAYCSQQAHSSVERGARIAGYRHIRTLETDERYALRPDALATAVGADRAAGLVPAIVTSCVGTTGTAAVDPVAAVSALASEHGLWHHVDAAYAGSAMVCPEHRHHQAGVETVDSYTFNPHKWLFTNFDCNVLWWADRRPLNAALSSVPPYLRNAASDSGEVVDYRDWQVPLGRRFRSLKLWWVLRSYGVEGLRHHIAEHVRLAHWLADRVAEHPRLELSAPPSFALTCFHHVAGDTATDDLATAINAVPSVYVTPSSIGGRRYIRVSVGQTWTSEDHVRALWAIIDAAA